MRNKASRNDNGGEHVELDCVSTIFNHPSRFSGRSSCRYLNKKELEDAHLHVLHNCEEVQPLI
ncbi:unnamed protein product, partial [Sphenostylis stenocarpa]